MSSMRTFSPRDLLLGVQKIKVCLYDVSANAESVIPTGEGFYITHAETILDVILRDLGVTAEKKSDSSKLDIIQRQIVGIEHGLFGKATILVEDPTLQDVILKLDGIYEKLYKREGSYCCIS